MANLGETFNPDEVPEDEFEPIPAGDYLVQIVESEIGPTKSGNGQILKLTLEILSGEYERRRIWERINIVNQNPDAQRIAQQQLKKLCDALGTGPIQDSEELHFKPVNIHVEIRQDKSGQYGPQNVIRKFWPADGAEPAKPVTQRQSAPAAAPAKAASAATGAPGKRPWGNRAA
jgi:hypothetical protein